MQNKNNINEIKRAQYGKMSDTPTGFYRTMLEQKWMQKHKYIFMSCHQNAGQIHNIKIANKLSKTLAKLELFSMIVKNQNYIH